MLFEACSAGYWSKGGLWTAGTDQLSNYPLLLATIDLLPALAAGCAAIVKVGLVSSVSKQPAGLACLCPSMPELAVCVVRLIIVEYSK